MTKWMIRTTRTDVRKLSSETGLSFFAADILAKRGINTDQKINEFLNPSVDGLINPHLMKDMDKGTDIVLDAVKNKKRIIVYGDYDVDGVTSTYVMYTALLKLDANAGFYIPDREKEGYGMNCERIEKLKDAGCDLILTCDNGISAINEIKYARSLGMCVVVTDHHDIPYKIDENGDNKILKVDADAVINPKQNDCKYPFKSLCGAGVAFKFVTVLFEKSGIDRNEALKYLEVVSLGTICDVVDMVGENRIIAKKGLEMLNSTSNIGLKALIKETGISGKIINSYHVGFIIGPCINATGRLENAKLSLSLLLEDDESKAEILAKKLHDLNVERQKITSDGAEELLSSIEKNNIDDIKVLVLYDENINESVAGIIAGRIKEKYNKPTIVITKSREFCKGSGRSIDGYDMFGELSLCRDLFINFGGHKMAAGITIKKENINELRKTLNSSVNLNELDMEAKIKIDTRLPLKYVSSKLVREISKMEPFGKENPHPLFAEKNIEVMRIYTFGKEKRYLKFFLKVPGLAGKIDALDFNGFEKFNKMIDENFGENKLFEIKKSGIVNIRMDFIFTVSISDYNKNVELMVKDFRLSKNQA